jgi:hypothetical protein
VVGDLPLANRRAAPLARGEARRIATCRWVPGGSDIGLTQLEEAAMYGQGLLGLLVLIADVWAIVNIVQSAADTGKKVLWVVLILVLPVLGVILWYFLGPRTGRT